MGPITFDTAAQYDNNFKIYPFGTTNTTASLNWASDGAGGGFIRSSGANTYAGFDQTAINPATPGNGGRINPTTDGFTDGPDDANKDFNNDLSNFKVSAKMRASVLGNNSNLGFFVYMNDSETDPAGDPDNDAINAFVRVVSATQIRFNVNAGASLSPSAGASIYNPATQTLPAGTLAVNTWYTFSVEAVGANLAMELRREDGSLIASDVFTIPQANLVRTTGQLGMRLGIPVGSTLDVDDFQIVAVPEPTSIGLASLAGGALLLRRRRYA